MSLIFPGPRLFCSYEETRWGGEFSWEEGGGAGNGGAYWGRVGAVLAVVKFRELVPWESL